MTLLLSLAVIVLNITPKALIAESSGQISLTEFRGLSCSTTATGRVAGVLTGERLVAVSGVSHERALLLSNRNGMSIVRLVSVAARSFGALKAKTLLNGDYQAVIRVPQSDTFVLPKGYGSAATVTVLSASILKVSTHNKRQAGVADQIIACQGTTKRLTWLNVFHMTTSNGIRIFRWQNSQKVGEVKEVTSDEISDTVPSLAWADQTSVSILTNLGQIMKYSTESKRMTSSIPSGLGPINGAACNLAANYGFVWRDDFIAQISMRDGAEILVLHRMSLTPAQRLPPVVTSCVSADGGYLLMLSQNEGLLAYGSVAGQLVGIQVRVNKKFMPYSYPASQVTFI